MIVSEMFKAVQGEGPEVGTPTFFIRLSGCNLNCAFCDSKYHKDGKEMDIKDIAKEVKKSKLKHITITGGEPTLQEYDIARLMLYLKTYKFSLESNGVKQSYLGYDNIVISPKKQGINMETLKSYALNNSITFKFVYENKKDKWWEAVIKKAGINKSRVYIMPEGKTREEQIKKMPEVIQYCQDKGFKFGVRLHVLAFDRKRGV